MDYFNTRSVCRIVGVSARQVGYWVNTGLIRPSGQEGTGRGRVRLFSFLDLLEIRVAAGLRAEGVSLQKIRKAVQVLRTHAPELEKPLAQAQLVFCGDSVFWVRDDKHMVDLIRRVGQLLWIFPVAATHQELRKRVIEMAEKRPTEVEAAGRTWQVTVQRDLVSGGFVGLCPELPGCGSQGETLKGLLRNLKDAIEGYLEVDEEEETGRAARMR